ncbi:histidine kinase [Muricauda oceani]|nr:histidine kinase [Allomuricauda oceani]
MGFRLLVVTMVFIVVKSIIDSDYSDPFFTVTSFFYYVSGVIFFMFSWELSDRIIKKHLRDDPYKGLGWVAGVQILGKTIGALLPLFAIGYYLALFHFASVLDLKSQEPWLQFRMDFSRAALIATILILCNLFYFSGQVKNRLHTRMLKLEKEVLATNYKILKNQISPHFLFNSLHTLTSLMYEDRDLASDFTARLASCYRYILDNQDSDLTSLDKELSFLDSFIFMMDVRHQTSLSIRMEINLAPNTYVIPTLTLQMLMENALKHNSFSDKHPMEVIISNDHRYLRISNTLRKRNDAHSSTQLGLENIKNRFSFYTTSPVLIEQRNGHFTVSLPLLKKNVEQKSPLHLLT